MAQKTLGISALTSQQVQVEILVKELEELLTAGHVRSFGKTVPVSQTKFVQFTHNSKAKHLLKSLRISEQI